MPFFFDCLRVVCGVLLRVIFLSVSTYFSLLRERVLYFLRQLLVENSVLKEENKNKYVAKSYLIKLKRSVYLKRSLTTDVIKKGVLSTSCHEPLTPFD